MNAELERFNLVDVHINVTLPIAREDDTENMGLCGAVMLELLSIVDKVRKEIEQIDSELNVELEY